MNIEEKVKNRYSLVLDAHTRGFLGTLAPWKGTFESHGWTLKNNILRVQQHKSTTTWRDEEEIKDYAYNRKGNFIKITIDEHDKAPYTPDIDSEITDGTTDALSATFMVLENYNKEQKCQGTSKVFDGKRSFEQTFVHQKDVTLNASKYNIYEGPAAECTVEVKPLKGKWHKKPRGWLSIQEQGRERGTMPTVWLASLDKNGPAIPVKIRVKTEYGTLFMHLAAYENNNGTMLVAEKRADSDEE